MYLCFLAVSSCDGGMQFIVVRLKLNGVRDLPGSELWGAGVGYGATGHGRDRTPEGLWSVWCGGVRLGVGAVPRPPHIYSGVGLGDETT